MTIKRITSVTAVAALLAMLATPALLATPANAAPTSGKQPALVNEQLVVASLDASGLPIQAQLINRLVATNLPTQQISAQTATGEIQYLDQRGEPKISGNNVLYEIGGSGQTSVATQATFGKPLPIAMHAEYKPTSSDTQGVDPTTIAGRSGTMSIRYTVTNTAVKKQPISYADALGNVRTQEQPVFAPFVGALLATLPSGLSLVDAPKAVIGTDDLGQTTLLWNLVLYPPMGNYQQELNYTVRGDDLQVPPAQLEVVPVTTDQAPAIGFASELLKQSVAGSAELANGLSELDKSAAALADGAAKLAAGQLAATKGTKSAASGSAALASGARTLAVGLSELSGGLNTLAGTTGLPKAAAASQQLTAAVQQIVAQVGSPSDPPIPFPPDPAKITLIQAIRATTAGSAALGTLSSGITAELASAVTSLNSITADAVTASGLIQDVITANCPAIGITSCAKLEAAKAKTDGISASSSGLTTSLGATRAESAVLTAGLTAMTEALQLITTGITELSVALSSGSSSNPGVYEGLQALTAGLATLVTAASKLAVGGEASSVGSAELSAGESELTKGLGVLAAGAAKLSAGSGQLSAGSAALHTDGTSKILRGVVDSSSKPSLASAYLAAAEARAPDAAPYPAPPGATARVAYVYTLEPPPPPRGLNPALLGIGLVFLAAFGVLVARRIRRPTSETDVPDSAPAGNAWPFS